MADLNPIASRDYGYIPKNLQDLLSENNMIKLDVDIALDAPTDAIAATFKRTIYVSVDAYNKVSGGSNYEGWHPIFWSAKPIPDSLYDHRNYRQAYGKVVDGKLEHFVYHSTKFIHGRWKDIRQRYVVMAGEAKVK